MSLLTEYFLYLPLIHLSHSWIYLCTSFFFFFALILWGVKRGSIEVNISVFLLFFSFLFLNTIKTYLYCVSFLYRDQVLQVTPRTEKDIKFLNSLLHSENNLTVILQNFTC